MINCGFPVVILVAALPLVGALLPSSISPQGSMQQRLHPLSAVQLQDDSEKDEKGVTEDSSIHQRLRPLSVQLHDDSEKDKKGLAEDSKRRALLTKSSAIMTGLVLGSQTAKAEEEKIVLSTSSLNEPIKYVARPADPMCADGSEDLRINVFERTAPSVVFIDTFTEQRDTFSPNVYVNLVLS